jgi:2-oxo-4-hydroxy-4-carboxy-5-ureidoimidazoline decarboxylase
MNSTLAEWNSADNVAAVETMLVCCGARKWAAAMAAHRPFQSIAELSAAADSLWREMGESDLLEAFACHPRIGERPQAHNSPQSAEWAREEQSSADRAPDSVLTKIAEGNMLYEQRFGFTYIVCATGKSAEEMLSILKRRLTNERERELQEAAEQQRQITQIRLGKWLAS